MRTLMIAAAVTLLTTGPLLAQEHGGQNASGYVTGLGGFATSVGNTTGNISAEAGIRMSPPVMVFGNVSRFANLQDLQPTLDSATACISAAGPLGHRRREASRLVRSGRFAR